MSMQVKASRIGAIRGGSTMPGMTSQRATVARGAMQYGDPGLFGFLGDVGGAILKGAGSLVGAVPGVGTVAGAALGGLGTLLSGEQEAPAIPTMIPQQPLPGVGAGIARLLPGGSTGMGYTQEQINNGKRRAGQRVPGTTKRWNKAPYTLKDGTYIPAGMKQVTIRKRNALNPRALDRALSRVTSAKRASKKLSRVTIRKAASCR